ncbi:MAG: hypothetical protein K0R28_4081 [Paenibacillus sp.]|nr:hypothetical protein [Paenibacillus sp.]
MLTWTIAETEEEREEAALFICRHSAELGLLYNWCTVMNSLMYCIEDNGLLIGRGDGGGVLGVLGHTVGTLEDGYKDRSRIEIHLLFVEKGQRRGAALLPAVRLLTRKLLELPGQVREVVFFTPSTDKNIRKFGQSAELTKTTEPPCGKLDFYTVAFDRMLRLDSA